VYEPAASVCRAPAPSTTLTSPSAAIVTFFFLSASRTRIVDAGAGPSVVPG
jgi:hypothetical protein